MRASFKKAVDSNEVERVLGKRPRRLDGSREFYDKRPAVTRYVNGGRGRLCEWFVDGKPPLLIMSEKHGDALLEHLKVPLERNCAPLIKQWESVREGKMILAVLGGGDSKVYILRKELAQKAFEAMKECEARECSI